MTIEFLSTFGIDRSLVGDRPDRIFIAGTRLGLAMVVLEPGSKRPLCTLSARELSQVGPHRGQCGFKHAITDPVIASRVVKRMMKQHGPMLNMGIEVGASRIIDVDCDLPEHRDGFLELAVQLSGDEGWRTRSYTYTSPGEFRDGEWKHHGSGHLLFHVPEGIDLPTDASYIPIQGGAMAKWRDACCTLPPSVRPEGQYAALGDIPDAPMWFIEWINGEVEHRRLVRAEKAANHVANDDIAGWSISTQWEEILEPNGWRPFKLDSCGCMVWTRPGDYSTPRSATAHEFGCTVPEWEGSDEGHYPIHFWTDNPGDPLDTFISDLQRTATKLQVYAAFYHGHDVAEAMRELELGYPEEPWEEWEGAPTLTDRETNGHTPQEATSAPTAPPEEPEEQEEPEEPEEEPEEPPTAAEEPEANGDDPFQRAKKEQKTDEPPKPGIDWQSPQPRPIPTIDAAAFHGLLGPISQAMHEYSGLDRIGLYAVLRLMCGNALGDDVKAQLDGGPVQHAQGGVVLIGPSGSGKDRIASICRDHVMGSSPGGVTLPFGATTGWGWDNIHFNIRSGPAVVNLVRDPRDANDTSAPTDTRALVMEPEFSRFLKNLRERDSTLSEMCRQTFDGPRLGNTAKTKDANDRASHAHMSWIGLSTEGELRENLADMSLSNGLANRFQFLLIEPAMRGNNDRALYEAVMQPLLETLHQNLADARWSIGTSGGFVPIDADAAEILRRLHEGVFDRVVPQGLMGQQEIRFMPHVLRDALVLAAIDGVKVITAQQVIPAALFRLHVTTVNGYLFGDRTGKPDSDAILSLMRIKHPEMPTKTNLHEVFGRNAAVTRIDSAVEHLVGLGLIQAGKKPREPGQKGSPTMIYRLTGRGLISYISCNPQGLREIAALTPRRVHGRVVSSDETLTAGGLLGRKNGGATRNVRNKSRRIVKASPVTQSGGDE